MNFKADPLIIKTLEVMRIGILQSEIQCNPSTDKLNSIIEANVAEVQNEYKLDEVNKIKTIAEARIAYRKLGNDPNRYRPSADSLIRRIVKGTGIYHINNVVDVLNLISIQSGFSIGGYNVSEVIGDIELGIGNEDEPYQGIGRGSLNISKLPVLRDNKGAFGTPTSDSQRTMIQPTTKSILFVFYDFGFNPILEKYLSNCAQNLVNFCSAKNLTLEIISLS